MSSAALTISKNNRKWAPWVIALPVAIAAMGVLWLATRWVGGGSASAAVGGKYYTVIPVSMDIKVAKDGELQSINNIDVANRVEGSTTIVQLVKEGTMVRKGDLLVELDSSTIREKMLTATLDKQNAQTALLASEEMRSIQQSQNEADLEASRVELQLAQLALSEYTQGKYPQSLADAQTALKMARITLQNKQEDLDKTKGLYAKGFVTAADVKKTELELTTSTNDLNKADRTLKVLSEYTHQAELAKVQSDVVQAEKSLARVRRKGASQLAQAEADVLTKKQTLANKTEALDKLTEQLGFCTIKAPADGMVVYSSDRRWDESGQISEQAQVRERQKLIRLPDLSQMKAVLRVNETQVTHLRLGQKARVQIVGFPEAVEATLTKISQVADSGSRWMNPDLKEYPVELVFEHTPVNLKPGMSCQAEIFTDRMDDVLAVPLAAIYSDRKKSYVFVQRGDQVEPVAVKLGKSNETLVQVAEGLSANANVMLLQPGQGRDILYKGREDDSLANGAAEKEDDGAAAHDGSNPRREGNSGQQPKSAERTPADASQQRREGGASTASGTAKPQST